MHGELLFQISDLFLVTLDLKCRVHHNVYGGFIGNLHHARCKLQSRVSLLNMAYFRPDVCNHDSLAITAKRVSQEVGQFGLSVWDVITLL